MKQHNTYCTRLTQTFILLFLLISLLSGCVTKESYSSKESEVTELSSDLKPEWQGKKGKQFKIDKNWWSAFGDDELSKLIEEGSKQNLDLRLLMLQMKKATLYVKSQKIERWPKLSATAGSNTTTTADQQSKTVQGQLGLSWDPDLWGRLKKLENASVADYKASEADYRAGFLIYINNITSGYFELRRLDEDIALQESLIQVRKKLVSVHKIYLDLGLEDNSNFIAQKTTIAENQKQLLENKRIREIYQSELCILLNKAPGSYTIPAKNLRKSTNLIDLPDKISINLLERRPDLISAELRIQSAFEKKDAARLARLPQITMSLNASSTAQSIASLPANWITSILPKISFPALDPQSKIRLKSRGIDYESIKIQYRSVLIRAAAELDTALMNYQSHRKQLEFEKQNYDAFESIHQITLKKVHIGVATQLDVLNVELSMIMSESRMLSLYKSILTDSVSIYNALGGEWTVPENQQTPGDKNVKGL